jgi:hypothetical protein
MTEPECNEAYRQVQGVDSQVVITEGLTAHVFLFRGGKITNA